MNGVEQMVIVYTDGMGTFQARCITDDCAWRGRWVKSQERAVRHAEAHVCENGAGSEAGNREAASG